MPAISYRPRSFTLKDGRLVTLRAVRESDADEIVRAFDRLSKASRYARFMHHKPQINPRALARGIQPEPGREFVFVATSAASGGHDIVGAGQYVAAAGDDPKRCEFAITLAEDWRGGGLAKELMCCLIRKARRDGYTHMEGFVLSDNLPMLKLASSLKFVPIPGDENDSTTRLLRALQASPKPDLVPQVPR